MPNTLTYADPTDAPRANRGLLAWALATTVAMFPLIWMGGLVTSKGAGMSVPDWPNTFGYNMWAVPWGQWVGESAGGVFYEHFHRLLGTLVGFLATSTVLCAFAPARCDKNRRFLGRAAVVLIGLAVVAYAMSKLLPLGDASVRTMSQVMSLAGAFGLMAAVAWTCRHREERRWLRRLAVLVLAAVIIQGILGGLRVVLVSTDLAIVHGIFGQLTLCAGGVLCLAATRWWVDVVHHPSRGMIWPAALLLGLCVLQLVVAAVMRHDDAGLAVPDVPLHFGQVMPPTDQASLDAANAVRAWEYNLPPVRLDQVWLHVAHRIGAVLITLAAGLTAWRLWRAAKWHVIAILGLIAVQITLGVLTVLYRKPADLATFHVATGALLLLSVALLAARQVRQYGARRTSVAPVAAESRGHDLPPRTASAVAAS